MIVLFNPLSTSPGKQPLPLSLMSLAAVLERTSEPWRLVDGNLTAHPAAEIIARLTAVPPAEIALLAVTVMPGPQLTQAVSVCRRVKAALPHAPICPAARRSPAGTSTPTRRKATSACRPT